MVCAPRQAEPCIVVHTEPAPEKMVCAPRRPYSCIVVHMPQGSLMEASQTVSSKTEETQLAWMAHRKGTTTRMKAVVKLTTRSFT